MPPVMPNTGQVITMGKARDALGLGGVLQVRMSNDLGVTTNLSANQFYNIPATVTLQPFPFSSRLGGRTTPNNY